MTNKTEGVSKVKRGHPSVLPRAVMFHHFWNANHPRGQGAISADQLDAVIEVLGVENILSPDEWRARAKAGTLAPHSTVLSFDDGLQCQYDIAAPVLRMRGLRAFWFIYSGPLTGEPDRLELYRLFRTIAFPSIDAFHEAFFAAADAAMDVDERRRSSDKAVIQTHLSDYGFYSYADRRLRYIRDVVLGPARYFAIMDEMMSRWQFDTKKAVRRLWIETDAIRALSSAGHEIGLHSHSHPTSLAAMTLEQQRMEFDRNRAELMKIVKQAPISASYPCNSYSSETIKILKDLGVDIAFRANLSQPYGSLMEIPRQDHVDLFETLADG